MGTAIRANVKTILGFLLAPLAGVAAVVAVILGIATGNADDGQITLGNALGDFAIGLFISYPAAIIFGIPAHLLLRRFRLTSFGAYVLSGLGWGLLVYTILALATDSATDVLILETFGLACMIAGGVSGSAFWVLVRPDVEKAVAKQV
jgi:hypothetical protein